MSTTARILYLDDDPLQLRALRRALRHRPYALTIHEDPDEALAALERDEVDVVLSDWRMPRIDGIEFLDRATQIRPSARRILVTGEREFGAAVEAINRVAVHRLVPKPWADSDMRRAVAEMVEAVQMQRENVRLQRVIQEQNDELSALNQDLERRVDERTGNVLDSLVQALDYRDTETQWHSRRVACYSLRLARELGLEGQVLRDVEWGALLHDVGKIGIPDRILHKPASLDAHEWAIMKTHPALGADMLEGIEFLRGAAEVVAQHHERWDGRGYPVGLAGEDICLGARIFAVIDAYDAITSDRPYRPGADYETAAAEIVQVAGTQLDPRVVEAFLAIDPQELAEIRREVGEWDYHEALEDELRLAS